MTNTYYDVYYRYEKTEMSTMRSRVVSAQARTTGTLSSPNLSFATLGHPQAQPTDKPKVTAGHAETQD
jgi:hypothetical protein